MEILLKYQHDFYNNCVLYISFANSDSEDLDKPIFYYDYINIDLKINIFLSILHLQFKLNSKVYTTAMQT